MIKKRVPVGYISEVVTVYLETDKGEPSAWYAYCNHLVTFLTFPSFVTVVICVFCSAE
jgi:hypothetical protein